MTAPAGAVSTATPDRSATSATAFTASQGQCGFHADRSAAGDGVAGRRRSRSASQRSARRPRPSSAANDGAATTNACARWPASCARGSRSARAIGFTLDRTRGAADPLRRRRPAACASSPICPITSAVAALPARHYGRRDRSAAAGAPADRVRAGAELHGRSTKPRRGNPEDARRRTASVSSSAIARSMRAAAWRPGRSAWIDPRPAALAGVGADHAGRRRRRGRTW